MIEVREHLLPFASMFVIVADGLEDEAVVGVVDVVLVIRLRLEQGISRLLTLPFDAQDACIKKAVELHKLEERRIGMLLNDCFDIVERGVDLEIAPAA